MEKRQKKTIICIVNTDYMYTIHMINKLLFSLGIICLTLSSYFFYLPSEVQKENFKTKVQMPFSINSLCDSISLTKNFKNECLRNFGFKDSNRGTIRIAVIDTGIDSAHPYLQKYVSPIGYDLQNYSSPFKDVSGHGTHVAGIIAQQIEAISDATSTIISFELISVKYTDKEASFKLPDAILHVLTKDQVDIINISTSGTGIDTIEIKALALAKTLGIQVIAASGNEGVDISFNQEGYPCKYALDNIICVANLNANGSLNLSSNFGMQVDLAAIGTNILSTLPNERWGYMSGTSMSVPRVTALVAYLKTINTKKTFFTRREILNYGEPMYQTNGSFKAAILNFGEAARRSPSNSN